MNESTFIVDDMINKIVKKNYVPNQKLPTERDLALYYSVSRHIVRRALESLQAMNQIYKIQGKGNYVSGHSHINTLLYNSMTKHKYQQITSKVIEFERLKMTKQLAETFDLSLHDDVWKFKRLRIADYKIVQLETTYMPCYLFPKLTQADIEKSVHTYVTEQGYQISHQITEYSAINADKETAEIMQCKKNLALVSIKNHGYLAQHVVFEVSTSLNLDYACAYISDYSFEIQRNRQLAHDISE